LPVPADTEAEHAGTDEVPRRWDRLRGLLFALLPHHAISRLAYLLARWRTPLKDPVIRWFVRHYRIDLDEASSTEPRGYPDFNSFFTRALKPGARPLPHESDVVISPVDGTLSQIGRVTDGRLLQAKGEYFSLTDLLAGDKDRAQRFIEGAFISLYLSPRDYHRVHMPIDGELEYTVHVPGRLFSVAPYSVRGVPRLFARNERTINYFHTPAGPLALVMVGALNVGAVETVWSGPPSPASRGRLIRERFEPGMVTLARGEEMGRFNLGSTVILLFGPGVIWDERFKTYDRMRLGQTLGRYPRAPQARSTGKVST
jgi:phosphatidylserine decarboxylase